MKRYSLLASFILTSQLALAEVSISPIQDPFALPHAAELPAMVGFPIQAGGTAAIQYNVTQSPILALNPKNSDAIVVAMNQDRIKVSSDLFGTTVPRTQEVAVSVSKDGGNTWKTGINLPHHFALDGSLSNGQSVTALRYSALGNNDGTLFMAGNYSDLQNDVNKNANSGIWVATSTDGGESWSEPYIVSVQESNAYTHFTGTADGTPDLAIDPQQLSNAYIAWDRPFYSKVQGYSSTIPMGGNIFFSRTNNFGATWVNPVEIYKITKDIEEGGHCSGVSLATAYRNQKSKALIASFMRAYKKPASPIFDKTVATTITDRVVIRSTDGGHRWDTFATVVSPFIYAESHDPTAPRPQAPSFQASDAAEKSHLIVNPRSGRSYLLWQAGSLFVADPAVAQFHPEVVLSVSRDFGKRWTKPVTVSRTPTRLVSENPQGYQAFNGNIFFLPNNIIGIVYFDYRNYVPNSSVASCDAWLALYRETTDELGGNTRIGLDFLAELRLTNPSFDAKIATDNALLRGIGDSVGIGAANNLIFTAYSVTKENDPSNILSEKYPIQEPQYQATCDFNKRVDTMFQKILIATESHEKNEN